MSDRCRTLNLVSDGQQLAYIGVSATNAQWWGAARHNATQSVRRSWNGTWVVKTSLIATWKLCCCNIDKINWDPTTPFFHMNLKFNRLTAAALPAVLRFLAARSSVTVNVGFNHFSVAELHKALAAAGCPQWLGKRVFAEIGEINRHLSNTSSLLDQSTRNFNSWTKHANTGTESPQQSCSI